MDIVGFSGRGTHSRVRNRCDYVTIGIGYDFHMKRWKSKPTGHRCQTTGCIYPSIN